MNDATILVTLGPEAPCGPSLEDDADYALLRARMLPGSEVQYGTFVSAPETPPWADIERECRRLLQRSRDIHLLVWLCRARTRLAQAEGLARALDLLAGVLETWPDAVHPQAVVDGMRDPAVRANALSALVDPQGLLADVRDIAVAAPGARRLDVREIERAWAVPRAADAVSPAAIEAEFARWRQDGPGEAAAALSWLAQASQALRRIVDWSGARLGADAPSLDALIRLLAHFDFVGAADADAAPSRPSAPLAASSAPDAASSRIDATRQIRAARDWFECHEPSSPVAVLLKQAERMVGLRFSQLADAIPLDLLRRWDATPENDSL